MAIEKVFSPNSIAVCGASRDAESVGYAVLANLLEGGYSGQVFVVNPKADKILNQKAYDSVADIDAQIDMAVIVVPDEVVDEVLNNCIKKGIKAFVIITAGFAETGDHEEEDKLSELAKNNNLTIIGPNCLGVINTDAQFSMNATFAKKIPARGNISFLSQSGAIGIYGLEYAAAHNMGFDRFVSLGNKAATSENELIKYFADIETTDLILAYLEDFNNPEELMKATKEFVKIKKKPLIVVKSGRSESGKRAAESHTGALSGRDEVVDDIFQQIGIIRAQNLRQLFDFGQYFSLQGVVSGNRLAIVTNAGGPSIIATDAASKAGLKVPELSDKLKKAISKNLPDTVSTKNPIDLVGDADTARFKSALSEVIKADEIDMIMVICTPQRNTDMKGIAQVIKEINTETNHSKAIVAALAGFGEMDKIEDVLSTAKIPNFEFATDAVNALAAGYSFDSLCVNHHAVESFDVNEKQAEEVLNKARKEKRDYLPAPYCYKVFEAYGLNTVKYGLANSAQEAGKLANEMAFPVAMSVVSFDIIHKTGTGGVILNVNNKKEAEAAYTKIVESINKNKPDAKIEGVQVQEMISGGPEMIMGVQNEDKFGHLLMFGLGGSFVEVLKDVRFKMIPVNRTDVRHMINKIEARELLDGKRGNAPSNIEALEDALLRLSQLITDFPFIKEIDLNPVYALEKEAVLADARILF